VRTLLIFVIPALHIRALIARDDRYPVVTLLSKDTGAVTYFGKLSKGKLIVSTLRLLHAENIRLDGFEPANYMRQARDD
jgi:hypothetical protein